MSYVGYVGFSVIEFFVIMFFGLCLFRSTSEMNLLKYLNLVYLSVVLSVISMAFEYYDIFQNTYPFIFMAIMVLLIRPLTKIKMKISLFIGTFAYLLYGLIQTTILVIADFFGVIQFGFDPLSHQGHLLQLTSSLITIVISIFRLYLSGGGFIFNPDKHSPNLKYSNKLIFTLMSLSTAFTMLLFWEAHSSRFPVTIYILLGFLLVSTMVLLFISHKRNEEEADLSLHKAVKKLKERRQEDLHEK